MNDTNPGFQPFGFTGGIVDADTGFVHLGARDLDPLAGRFTTRDPAGVKASGTNLYAYGASDPVNLVDPSGLAGVPPKPAGYVPVDQLVKLLLQGKISASTYERLLCIEQAYDDVFLAWALDQNRQIAQYRAETSMYDLWYEYAGGCVKGAAQGAVVGAVVGEGVGAVPGGLWGCATSLGAADASHYLGQWAGTTVEFADNVNDIRELLKYLREIRV